jgi:hypothetical protein
VRQTERERERERERGWKGRKQREMKKRIRSNAVPRAGPHEVVLHVSKGAVDVRLARLVFKPGGEHRVFLQRIVCRLYFVFDRAPCTVHFTIRRSSRVGNNARQCVGIDDDLNEAFFVSRGDGFVAIHTEVEPGILPQALHRLQNLQGQLVLAKIVTGFEHDGDGLVFSGARVCQFEDQPQRLFLGIHDTAFLHV